MRRGADRMERRGKSREGGEGVSPFFPLTRDAADAVTNPDTNTNTQRITRGEESKEGGFDEDWVETTNVAAFRSLAHWIEHHHDNEDEMSYSTRIDEKGRTVYRFRVGPKPPSPTMTTTTTEAMEEGATKPTIEIQQPTPKSLRTTRSIPLLFSSTTPSPTNSRTTSTTASRSAGTSGRSEERMRRSGSTPGLYASAQVDWTGVVAGNGRDGMGEGYVGSEGDVLGRLLGWIGTTVEDPLVPMPNEEEMENLETGLPPPPPPSSHLASRRPSASSPPSTLAHIPTRSSARAQSDPALTSPFGSNVRPARTRFLFPPPSSMRMGDRQRDVEGNAVEGDLEGGDARRDARGMVIREVPSSDSMRTERGLEIKRPRFEDETIFDLFQTSIPSSPIVPSPLAATSPTALTSTSPALPFTADARTHARIQSTSSISSSLSGRSEHLTTTAQEITVVTAPGDDPRFVIWGRQTSSLVADGIAVAGAGEIGGLGGRRSSSGMLGGSTSSSERASPMTMHSRRWSKSSAATSVRDSIDSSRGSASPPTTSAALGKGKEIAAGPGKGKQMRETKGEEKRFLMAATPERWIAELTSSLDSTLLTTFFLTYRSFITPSSLLSLLLTRFNWSLRSSSSPLSSSFAGGTSPAEGMDGAADEAGRRIVRVRSFLVLRYWLVNHFTDDFVPDRELRARLCGWLNETSRRMRTEGRERDGKLIQGLKRVCWRVKEEWLDTTRGALHLREREEEQEGELDLILESKSPTIRRPLIPLPSSSTTNLLKPLVPLPDTQNPLSRSLTTALGNFGRFKRMLKSRSSLHPSSSHSRASSDVDGGATEGEDLLYSKDDLENYLDSFRVSVGEEEGEEEGGRTEDSIEFVDFDAVGFALDEELARKKSSRTLRSVISRLSFHPTAPPTFIPPTAPSPAALPSSTPSAAPSFAPSAALTPFIASTAFNVDDDIFESNLGGKRPLSKRIELDDIDLSDDDEDAVEVKKSLRVRRLPGGAKARMLARLRPLSTDSVESRYSFRLHPSPPIDLITPEEKLGRRGLGLADVSSINDESIPAGMQVVPNFILEGLLSDSDSDDEVEGGDVESALRRLEGLIDVGREEEKFRRVEVQMERSRKAAEEKEREKERLRKAQEGEQLEEIDTTDSPHISPRQTHLRTHSTPISLLPPHITTIPRPLVPAHRSFLHNIRTEILAQQFTLIGRDLFRVLTWQEFVSFVWRDRSKEVEIRDWEVYLKDRRREDGEKAGAKGGDVGAIVGRFNLMSAWVASEIVLTVHLDERVALIAKFIRLAFKCYRLSNFNTTIQIIAGLQLPCVDRLHKTFAKVPSWEMHVFKRLIIFTSAHDNFKCLRSAMEVLVEESAFGASTVSLKGKSTQQIGCIPFVGIFLKDLNEMANLPTFLDPAPPNLDAVVDPTTGVIKGSEGVGLYPLVNVHKFRMISQIITQINAFQEIAETYPFTPISATYFKCLKLRSLPLSSLHAFSARLE